MGTFVVVDAPELIEGALLYRKAGTWWTDRLALECPVHPLVGSVLLGVSGQDPLMLNAEPQPPDVELREAVNAGRGERHAVVRPDRAREPMLTEQPIEDRAYSVALRPRSPWQASR